MSRSYEYQSLYYFANALREVLDLDPIPFTTEGRKKRKSDEEKFYIEPRTWPWGDADSYETCINYRSRR